LQSKNEKSSESLLLFYDVLKIPMGNAAKGASPFVGSVYAKKINTRLGAYFFGGDKGT
jgi:hypothetical protein